VNDFEDHSRSTEMALFHNPYSLRLICMYTEFELPGFTRSTDMIQTQRFFLKKRHVT